MQGHPGCPRCRHKLARVTEVAPLQLPYVICTGCDSTFPEKASLGDTIECDILTPMPDGRQKLYTSLDTEDALTYGNLLVASGRWKVVK